MRGLPTMTLVRIAFTIQPRHGVPRNKRLKLAALAVHFPRLARSSGVARLDRIGLVLARRLGRGASPWAQRAHFRACLLPRVSIRLDGVSRVVWRGQPKDPDGFFELSTVFLRRTDAGCTLRFE